MKTDRFLRDVIRHVSPSSNRGGPPVWHAGPPPGMPPGSFEPVPGVVYVPCGPAGDHSDKRWQGLQRVTLGQPEHGDEDHDCDAMGCLQEHVVERVVLDPDVEWSREDEVATLVALRGSRSPFYVEITDLVRVYLHVDPQQPHDTPWTVNVGEGEGEGVTVARGAGGTLNEALAEARAWVSRLRVGLGAWSSSLVADRVRANPPSQLDDGNPIPVAYRDDLPSAAVFAPGWRWMTGMKLLAGGRVGRLGLVEDGGNAAALGHLPDLDDPVTQSCLVLLLRERHGRDVMVRPEGSGWVVSDGRDPMFRPLWASDVEALVGGLWVAAIPRASTRPITAGAGQVKSAPPGMLAAMKTISYDADSDPVDPGSVLLETARAVVPGIKAAVDAYQNEARPASRANPTIAKVIGELVQAFPDAARSVFVLLVVPGLRIRAVSLLGADPDVTAECHGCWYVRNASRPGPPYKRDTQEEAEALIRDLIESQQKAVFVRVST